MTDAIALDIDDLRAVTAYAAENAAGVLAIFEASHPSDTRPRDAIAVARAFAQGGERGPGGVAQRLAALAAWAALEAAGQADDAAANQAARAAMSACGAAYLHPLARATQVRHILGAAAHATHAAELAAGAAPDAGADHLEQAARLASPRVIEVLCRYPPAPPGGGRVGELLRALDRRLRGTALAGEAGES